MMRIAVAILPVLAFAIVELGLHLVPGLDGDQFVDIGPVSYMTRVEVDGRSCYQVTHPSIYPDRRTVFAIDKPPQTLRVFCLGGSAAASWPHPPGELWSAYLSQALQAAFPDHRVEVINLGAHGFASYRVRKLADQVVTFDPDLVIVWSGNNEFLETRHYDTSVGVRVLESLPFDLRLVRLARRAVSRAVLSGSELAGIKEVFWKKVKQESLILRSDPQQFLQVQEHYAESIAAIAEQTSKHDIPLLMLTVPVNLRDWLPNVSADSLGGPEGKRWAALLTDGRRKLMLGHADQAISSLKEAGQLFPVHAETRFWLGRAQEEHGDTEAAVASYQAACDLDMNPFRSISAFRESLGRIASQANKNVYLLDLAGEFQAASANGIPGYDLFIDYVHPNRAGNLVAARSVFEKIVAAGLIGTASGDTVFAHRNRLYRGEPYHENFDLQLQTTAFGLFCLNHQYDAAITKGRWIDRVIQTKRDSIQGVRGVPTATPSQILDGVGTFSAWQDVQNRLILGQAVPAAEIARARKLLDGFYSQYLPYGNF